MAEMTYATNGKGNLGVTLGAIGTGLSLFNGGGGGLLGNLLGGGGANQTVNRYEAEQQARIAQLETEVKLRDANTYTDQKLLGVVEYVNGKIEGINQRLAEQAVWNATQTAGIGCMAQQIAELKAAFGGITKTVIPREAICPEVMPRYNSWEAPTAPTTGGNT